MSTLTIKRPFYRKKKFLIPAIILLLLIAFRIYLPTLVKNYVNKTLANLPGYYGQVDDIDIALYRGAYVIKGLYLNVIDGTTEVPFLKIAQTDISVEWKSLFHGKFVSEIYLDNPEVIYLLEDQETMTEEEEPAVEDWTKTLNDLVPIKINKFGVTNGNLAYVEVNAEPNIDLQLNNLNMTVDNLRNVYAKEHTLPSTLHATASSIGKGKMKLEGKLNAFKEIPDMDLTFSLEDVDATALNDYTHHYAKIDFESGTLNLYSEMAIADGYLTGYVKPLLKDSKLIGKDDSFLAVIWEGFVGFFKFLLKNQKTDNLATKVPFEGDLTAVQTGVLSTVFNVFENAWISAFQMEPDGDIEFEDAFQEEKEEKK